VHQDYGIALAFVEIGDLDIAMMKARHRSSYRDAPGKDKTCPI
jgi:hypothetical protein